MIRDYEDAVVHVSFIFWDFSEHARKRDSTTLDSILHASWVESCGREFRKLRDECGAAVWGALLSDESVPSGHRLSVKTMVKAMGFFFGAR